MYREFGMFLDDDELFELAEDSVEVALARWPLPALPDRRDNIEGGSWTLLAPRKGDEAGLRLESMMGCAAAEAAAALMPVPPLRRLPCNDLFSALPCRTGSLATLRRLLECETGLGDCGSVILPTGAWFFKACSSSERLNRPTMGPELALEALLGMVRF